MLKPSYSQTNTTTRSSLTTLPPSTTIVIINPVLSVVPRHHQSTLDHTTSFAAPLALHATTLV